jgi:hypothetical protein
MTSKTASAFLLLVGLTACGAPPPDDTGGTDQRGGKDPVFDRLLAMGYHPEVIEDRGDHYVVEGDMVFPKAPATPGAALGDLSQRWSNQLHSRTLIRVKLDSTVQNDQGAVLLAMLEWNKIGGTGFKFNQVTSGAFDTLVEAKPIPGEDACAQAQTPFTTGAPGSVLTIDTSPPAGCASIPRLKIMMHELGHIIGFQHTNNCADTPMGNVCVAVPGVGGADAASVMSSTTTTPTFTDNDKLATQALYPPAMATGSRASNIVETFMVNRDGKVRRLTWQFGQNFVPFNHGIGFSDGQSFMGPIAAVSMLPGTVSLFGIGPTIVGNVRHFLWNGSTASWSIDSNANPGFLGQITAVSTASNTVTLYGVGFNDNVIRYHWNGSSWSAQSIAQQFDGGMKFTGPLTAVNWGGNTHIFGVGGAPIANGTPTNPTGTATATTILQMWFDGTWHFSDMNNQVPIGNDIFLGHMSVFKYGADPRILGVGRDGTFKQLYFSNGWFWESVAMPATSRMVGAVSGTSAIVGNISVFGLDGGFGSDSDDIRKGGSLIHRNYSSSGWNWFNHGNPWPL